ncbi:ClpV1 family T6SS ATPase [Burkholderia vietnamiensis]|uniref:type VI secretion system ATPase TssH n=1 Tax=Burkholderia vietnamiensis TaxID=60552 RepID=UPI00075D9DED|nr:type VI secretion system ATPase TssH [Burkholderia vietnamiensis]KVR80896.1 ClpV1 family T6SS ATPase [Burkholderia vietnamiensis]MBR8084510.1 type VI secretion system ATPase TssH [Burkholderia vietnamiensis]MDN7816860.1 type VI secretion system ATPase TssH [Burkholderia vietnamiensis]HDR9037457.1 type VI secretion system ATPase TssH [Burkholderia vietnamiensis]
MTISRQTLFGKLGVQLYRGIESATSFCKLRGNPFVELVHWLHQLLQQPDGDLQRIVRHAGIDRDALERDFARALAALPAGASSISDFSWHIESAIERAWVLATLEYVDRRVRGAWLIAALVSTPDLRRVLLSISPEFGKIPVDGLGDVLPAWIDGSPETVDGPYDHSEMSPATPGEASGAMPGAQKGGSLEQYCTDLTARARAGEIDPVIGRELEIRTMIDVLLRRRQNNPLLTGEAGVGKTAVVEGLARAIASGNVPPNLADVRLLSLDVGALLAGASMKGEFEARLKGLLEAAAKSTVPVILFIDEIHTLIGAGGQAGTGDAANLLKPALARGKIRTIGATTWAEYKRHIEKDPALTRRFQVLQVAEPSEAAAIDMVRGLVQTFSTHHGVVVRDEAIRGAVTLSHRYIPARQLPDKAISLLDTACARVALSQHATPRELDDVRQRLAAARTEEALLVQEARIGLDADKALASVHARIDAMAMEEAAVEARWREQAAAAQALLAAREDAAGAPQDSTMPLERLRELEHVLAHLQGDAPLVFPEVDEAIVAEIVSDWTGIPVGRMVTDEVAAVRRLPETLEARVIGQTDALRVIGERVQTARAGLTDPKKPLGVFLLAGPSGVGKTETALALAEALYGGEQNLITINMSEYQEAHTVSGLKGAPPGYVGYGEGGVLTEAVRRRPYSVVLLDEVEKAHRDVHEMFFQVFDKGYMEDGDGRHIDFRNTTILLTSNVGSDLTANLCADKALAPDMDGLRDALTPELLKAFPAAFLGRVTVVPYRPLADEGLARIVRLHLGRVVKRMADSHAIALTFDDAVVDYIVGRCLVQETGARVLIGFIEQHILPRLSAVWLDAFTSKAAIARIAIGVADSAAAPLQALTFDALPIHLDVSPN